MPAASQASRQLRVLRQKAVARVNRIDPVLHGNVDDAGNVEVRPNRLARFAHLVGFVGLEAVQGVAILVGVDGHGANAELMGRAEHADGDFATVGDQNLADR